jgi:cholinesterase
MKLNFMGGFALTLLILCASSLIGQAMTTPAVNLPPYTMLYVFGDSYSDSGSGYVDSNGPTAVAYLARNLDSTKAP